MRRLAPFDRPASGRRIPGPGGGSRSGATRPRAPAPTAPAGGNLALARLFAGGSLQAKLEVNRPGDRWELEADRVADRIVAGGSAWGGPAFGAESAVSDRRPGRAAARIQRMCQDCEEEEIGGAAPPTVQRQGEDCERKSLQAKARPGSPSSPGSAAGTGRRALRGGGEPLPGATRSFFEGRFGRRFGDVRIHRGATAAGAAEALGARAFTVGRDIAFGAGEYTPGTARGRHLLAHELTHVVQQADGLRTPAIQRQEAGTYVSTHGPQSFLDAAAHYYRAWGHPNVRRVSTLDDVLRDLSRGRGALDTFRIVAHANPRQLLIGLMSSIASSAIDRSVLTLKDPQRFRARLAPIQLINDTAFGSIVTALRNDPQTSAEMTTLGVAATPANDSPVGILLRAIAETHFLDAVRLNTGGRVNFRNRAVLDAFNRQRLATFRRTVVGSAPRAQRASVGRAIAKIIAELPGVLRRSGVPFRAFTQAEADQFGDALTEPTPRGGTRLRREISTLITEGGARGPFLRRLERVKARVTSATHIEIRGCQIGRNPDFLDDFKSFMGRPGDLPSISAPDLFQYFFPLSFETFPGTPTGNADLRTAFGDPATGLERDFVLQHRVRQGELIQVAIAESPARFIARYGLAARGIDLAALQRLNPQIRSWTQLTEGTDVFLKARRIPAGPSRDFSDFADRIYGDRHKWPMVWSFNPQLRQPTLQPNDQVFLQSQADRTRFGMVSAAPGFVDLRTAVRGGRAVVSIETTPAGDTVPRLRVDDRQRAAAMGRWLASQRFDPRGRTAAVLSRLFRRNFRATALRLHMLFLSRSFPNVEDPIFPDDPRFHAHIIRR